MTFHHGYGRIRTTLAQRVMAARTPLAVRMAYWPVRPGWLRGTASLRIGNTTWWIALRAPTVNPEPHLWQEWNRYGNTCHHPGCQLTQEQHPRIIPGAKRVPRGDFRCQR